MSFFEGITGNGKSGDFGFEFAEFDIESSECDDQFGDEWEEELVGGDGESASEIHRDGEVHRLESGGRGEDDDGERAAEREGGADQDEPRPGAAQDHPPRAKSSPRQVLGPRRGDADRSHGEEVAQGAGGQGEGRVGARGGARVERI